MRFGKSKNMSDPIIVCENLVKIYKLLDDVEVQALQGLELTVDAGEMVGVVGASGSEKIDNIGFDIRRLGKLLC